MPTITVNGTELNYIEQGTGEPVLMVHGSVSDLRTWYAQIGTLSKHYRAIAYSRRYHYPNALPVGNEPYTAELHADDLAALINEMGIAPAHLVCSSWGGCVALIVAVRHPELVRSLVLGEPPLLRWLRAVPGAEALLEKQGQVMAASRAAFEQGDAERGVAILMESVLGEGAFNALPPSARAKLMEDGPEMALEARMSVEEFFPALTREQVATIHIPTLLLTGDSSPAMFHLVVDELERYLPNRKRATIAKASHSMHNMNPSAYNSTVLEFLAGLAIGRKWDE